MCGIVGFADFRTKSDKSILNNLLSKIEHRGPDSRGTFYDRNVSLGIQRLSIIDLKTGDQPISNEDKTVTVVFNGEIYNFLTLRKELIEKGHKLKTRSDTEVLVHLYEEYGIQMPKYLNGMFAFAIWDAKAGRLFLSRDCTGIKPLYYYYKDGQLIFASEIKGITSHPEVKSTINTESIKLYTFFGYIPNNSSPYQYIHRLPPGYSLIFSKNGKRLEQFCNQTYFKSSEGDLGQLLEDSVRLQSVADVELGVFLSGGLDSSLVAYYLKKLAGRKVKTFSIGFSEKSFDESFFAKKVASQLRTDHYQEEFSSKDVIDLFPEIMDKLDEPIADPSLFPTYKVSALAKKYVKVVLSGDGGDELFGGYPTYQGHIVAQSLKYLPKSIGESIPKIIKLLPRSSANYPKTDVVESFFSGLYLAPFKRHSLWMSVFPNLPPKEIKMTFYKDLWFREVVRECREISDNLILQMQYFDYLTYLRNDLLVKVDLASMFNSLEVRVPFLDPRIIAHSFSGEKSHLNILQTKKMLRVLAKDIFPETIVYRKKKGFGIPLAKWLCSDLSDFAFQFLKNKDLYEFIDRVTIDKLWENHQNRRQNNTKAIWMLVILSAWLQKSV